MERNPSVASAHAFDGHERGRGNSRSGDDGGDHGGVCLMRSYAIRGKTVCLSGASLQALHMHIKWNVAIPPPPRPPRKHPPRRPSARPPVPFAAHTHTHTHAHTQTHTHTAHNTHIHGDTRHTTHTFTETHRTQHTHTHTQKHTHTHTHTHTGQDGQVSE